MVSVSLVEQEEQRLEVLSDNYVSPVEREERYDRITRTAMRLLEIPYAFLALMEADGPVLRSVHGLPAQDIAHALAFCDPQIVSEQVLAVPDASANPLFWHNALVTGPAHVRSFLAVPLTRAPGVLGGTLCALHNEPRAFRNSDTLALQDLARIAESELRLQALTVMHNRVLARVERLERSRAAAAAAAAAAARAAR